MKRFFSCRSDTSATHDDVIHVYIHLLYIYIYICIYNFQKQPVARIQKKKGNSGTCDPNIYVLRFLIDISLKNDRNRSSNLTTNSFNPEAFPNDFNLKLQNTYLTPSLVVT